MSTDKDKKITVRLKRSLIGTTAKQRANVRGLGLKKIRGERTLENTPAVRGMVKQVLHLVEVIQESR
jgi:large subunit ribosomal protein L30